MATFTKDNAGMRYVLRAPGGLVYPHIEGKTRRVTTLSKRQVGKDTRALVRSIGYTMEIRSVGGVTGKVTAADKKAIMHHNGTKPHIIVPKRATALRFKYRGRIVYRQLVRHPGTQPNRFLTDPLRTVIR